MKIAIVGLGLIGGSLALALKKDPKNNIYGIDVDPQHQEKALSLGLVDEITDLDFIPEADAVIIAVPVDIIPELTKSVLDKVQDNALVFDVGSTKEVVCQTIKDHENRSNFVAMHPIAGTEFSGPEAAVEGLFTNKVNIICEREQSNKKQLETLLELLKPLQMRNVFIDSAEKHDKHIAYVSHLSHISSFILGKTVLEIEKEEKNIFDMAGSGFESTVRLAKSSPKTWTPIFMQNKKHILRSLNEFISNLEEFKKDIEMSSQERIYATMKDTNHIKDILNGIIK